jgi:hypothetical protein
MHHHIQVELKFEKVLRAPLSILGSQSTLSALIGALATGCEAHGLYGKKKTPAEVGCLSASVLWRKKNQKLFESRA